MTTRWTMRLAGGLGVLAVVLGGAGCGSTQDETDGGTDGDGGLDQCVVDDSARRPATAPNWELDPDGEPADGVICPTGDVDHYWFEIDTPGTILSVGLSNNVTMSPVDLCYKLLPPDEDAPAIADRCDHDGMDGVTELAGSHYLASAGTYFIEVRDESGDDQDARNAYALEIAQVADPDANEPNNSSAEATGLAASAQGYLSFTGDQDWFAVQVAGVEQLMNVDLTTAEATPVDLRYTVYEPDGTTPINTGFNDNGQDGPTALHDILALGDPGTYYVLIEDEGGDDADYTVGYSLQISLRDDPDQRDRGASNDTPEQATAISSGVVVSDAYLASRADQDWYRIEAPGVSDTDPALLEIDVHFPGGAAVDPAVDLIVGDPRTPCSAGDDCEVLNWTCGAGSCSSAACRNAQCPSHECLEHEQRCRGAGFCLPEGGCGIRHLVMHGPDWSTSGTPSHLHTVAPMYGDVYYILVRDFMGDDLDPDNAYSLTVTVRTEPDGNEQPPNGIYLPYATDEQDDDTRDWNRDLAVPINCSDDGTVIECGPISGYLSFRGDQDWFVLQGIPTEDEPTPVDQSLKVDYDLQYSYDFNGAADLFINYEFWLGGGLGGRPYSAFNHEGPDSGIVGDGNPANGGADDDCAYLCGEYNSGRPIYLRVQHSDRKKWDYDNPYDLTVRVYRACPLECPWCAPDATDYACPTPDNPCPRGDCQ